MTEQEIRDDAPSGAMKLHFMKQKHLLMRAKSLGLSMAY